MSIFSRGILAALPLFAAALLSCAGNLPGLREPANLRTVLEQVMPDAMSDGIVKLAVLINERPGENAWQFIGAAVSEGRSMGFIVDAFALSAENETERFEDLAGGIAAADYDGLVFVNGEMDFAYDILKPISDNGIKIVSFEALAFRQGRSVPGLIATFQDDYGLARLSLETLIRNTSGENGRPPRVLRIVTERGVTFMDRHDWEFNEFVRGGRIIEAGRIVLGSTENARASAMTAVFQTLPDFPAGSVDALWVPWSEFAVGAITAIEQSGRQDIKLFSTGISSESMRFMRRNRNIWPATSVVDPALAGTVTMRLLAVSLAGEDASLKENSFYFAPQPVMTSDLNRAVNVSNLSVMLPDWSGSDGLFDGYGWMLDLKEAAARSSLISVFASWPGLPPPEEGAGR